MPRTLKDSGIPWVGQIPADWEQALIGSLYKLRNTKVSDKQFSPLSVTMKGILPQLEHAAKTNDGDNRKLVCQGDFVINSRSDRRGSCGISDFTGSVSLINLVLIPQNNMNPGYYNWLFHTTAFADEFYKWGHGIVDDLWTTRWQDMKNIMLPLPTIAEQKKIADFLDKKCGEVDALAHNIRQQIDTLEQYKRTIITETVTKGLNPSAPMKDSGIPWIGQIPKHWRTLKVKFISSLLNGYAFDSDMLTEEGHSSVIRIGDITNGSIEVNSALKYDGPTNMLTAYQIKQGDIVIALSGATVGKIGYIAQQYPFTFINQRVGIIRSDFAHFLNYALQAGSFLPFVLLHSTASAQPNISLNTIGNYIIACPNETEQQTIASYLDDKCGEIDALIKTKQKQLAKLEEYKKAIIFEYVTGKKPVPEEER